LKARRQILLLAVAVLALTARSAPVQPVALAPAGVLVLANAADPESLAIARHYAAVRGVPSANFISWPMPTTETVNWREFVDKVWNPLLARLVADRWIDAIPMATFDAVGRRKHAVNGHRIGALVTCRGVPLRIEHDPSLYAEVPPVTRRGEFRTNAGAVDAELSLLANPNYPINAFVSNPLFQNAAPSYLELAQVIRVSRLDGPSVAEIKGLVDRAVAAEGAGLRGRAYVDVANRDPVGDAWFEATARQLAELGFDTAVDREPGTMPAHARFDAPVLYFGWYSGAVDGPFTLPGFRFPPGAIALHLHSFSAATLRSADSGWTGPFVARGVTATVGNVHEPYLQFTHPPHLLLRALARGAPWVEAVYFALPALSWQAVAIGDPLYRPFPPGWDSVDKAAKPESSRLDAYEVIRRMRRMEAEGRETEAMATGLDALRLAPTLALGLALARRQLDRGDAAAAADSLAVVKPPVSAAADEWALLREAALLLKSAGRPSSSVDWWKRLLSLPALGANLRFAWLPEAIQTARSAGASTQAEAWQTELLRLTPVNGAVR
jgi:uncharacterized protein (TIGR03790 family)